MSLECGALTKQAKDMGNQLNLGTPEYKLAGPVARSQSPYDLGGLNHPEISSVADVRQPSMREQLENGLFRLQDAYANDLPGTGTLLGAGYQMLGGKIEHLPQVVEWGTEIGGPLSTLAAAKSGLPKAIKGGNVKAPTGGTKNLQTTVQNNGGQGPTTMPAVAAGSVKHVNPTGSMQNCTNCAYVVDQQLATGSKASALPMSQPLPFAKLNSLYKTNMSNWVSRGQIEKTLMSSGEGTRAIIYGMDSTGSTAHVWNAVVQNGRVNYIDGQTGGSGLINFKHFPNLRYGITNKGK